MTQNETILSKQRKYIIDVIRNSLLMFEELEILNSDETFEINRLIEDRVYKIKKAQLITPNLPEKHICTFNELKGTKFVCGVCGVEENKQNEIRNILFDLEKGVNGKPKSLSDKIFNESMNNDGYFDKLLVEDVKEKIERYRDMMRIKFFMDYKQREIEEDIAKEIFGDKLI